MIAALLALLGIASGCATILLSVAFSIAHNERRFDGALVNLIAATGAMALSVTFSIAAGRFL